MIITTTPNIEGKQIVEYKQVVFKRANHNQSHFHLSLHK